jgi:hypothetical protein
MNTTPTRNIYNKINSIKSSPERPDNISVSGTKRKRNNSPNPNKNPILYKLSKNTNASNIHHYKSRNTTPGKRI